MLSRSCDNTSILSKILIFVFVDRLTYTVEVNGINSHFICIDIFTLEIVVVPFLQCDLIMKP